MKHFILLFFTTTLLCQGQIIDFPDPNFKTALLNNYPEVDTNGDGEIQINEAQSFDENLNLSDKNISDLTGIEYFVNTRWLYASRNNFIEVDLSNNIKLESIYLSNTNLSELNLSNNNDLYRITVTYNNELTSITLPENPIYLHSIELQHNQLSSLDLNSLTQLQLLYCNNNQLTQLHLNNDNSLELDCSNNQLLDLTIISNSLTKFQKLKCTGNLFENLNLSESNVIYLDCGDNPLLETINWRNGLTWRFKPEFGNWNNFENLPNLNTVCYGPGYNQMFMDFVLAEVGHSLDFYNNETCDALSVNENNLNVVSITPNPAENTLKIEADTPISEIVVYNELGQLVLSIKLNIAIAKTMLDITALGQGLYFVKITDENGNSTVKKVIKKK